MRRRIMDGNPLSRSGAETERQPEGFEKFRGEFEDHTRRAREAAFQPGLEPVARYGKFMDEHSAAQGSLSFMNKEVQKRATGANPDVLYNAGGKNKITIEFAKALRPDARKQKALDIERGADGFELATPQTGKLIDWLKNREALVKFTEWKKVLEANFIPAIVDFIAKTIDEENSREVRKKQLSANYLPKRLEVALSQLAKLSTDLNIPNKEYFELQGKLRELISYVELAARE